MIHYITLGSNDLKRAQAFYDPVLAALGFVPHVVDLDGDLSYGPPAHEGLERHSIFWIVKPFLEAPASWGNGTMIALAAETRAAVEAFHAAALANGGKDEGTPGLRPYSPNFYACYVRDPDGNKLSAVCQR